ncbi:helix-turn-helix domain-containing protein [Amycolatopsis aidingensis]|uniref:helix-turn-helix domain-containing protein n=1 Tax=Amycolatopsis aidingensis TaxID=2842453 RepID=UPI001C0D7445|nr:helix-turn-helix transcriptional regulator [Amycolatopsis aidingensis]
MRWPEDAVNQLYEAIGDRIRAARTQHRLTQAHLGKRLGLTRSSIANIEAGRQRVMIHWLVQIAEELDVPPATLFALPDQPARTAKALLAPDSLDGQPDTTHDFVSSVLRRATND